MEPSIRRRIASQVEKSFTEEGVVNPTISVFIRKFSTNIKFSATDYIHAIQGLLWYPYTKRKDKERNVARSNFLLSLGIFSGYLQFFICSKNSHSILERGLKLSKAHLERIHRTASMLLSNKTIKTIKSFKLCVLPHDQTEASPSISKDDTGKEIASPQIDWWASNSALASLSLFLCEYCNVSYFLIFRNLLLQLRCLFWWPILSEVHQCIMLSDVRLNTTILCRKCIFASLTLDRSDLHLKRQPWTRALQLEQMASKMPGPSRLPQKIFLASCKGYSFISP